MESKSNLTRPVELERKVLELEPQIPDGPEKQAISLLHAMIQDASRHRVGVPAPGGTTLEEIANLHKHAPPMEGRAENDRWAKEWRLQISCCWMPTPTGSA